MCPSGVELDLDQRSVGDVCEGAPVRARRAGIRDRRSAPGFSSRGHARAMDGIAPNGQLNAADAFLQNAPYQSKVGFFHRSEEHTSELQSLTNLVCRLLLEKKKCLEI